MVRPIIGYAASAWDPHTLLNINKLESIQRTAARFSFNDFSRYSSVTNMLSSLNLPLLQARRTQAKLSTFYKIINGYLIVPTDDLIPKLSNLRSGYYHQPMALIDGTNSLLMKLIPLPLMSFVVTSVTFMITPVRYNLLIVAQ